MKYVKIDAVSFIDQQIAELNTRLLYYKSIKQLIKSFVKFFKLPKVPEYSKEIFTFGVNLPIEKVQKLLETKYKCKFKKQVKPWILYARNADFRKFKFNIALKGKLKTRILVENIH
jgi:hypothetical protein